MRRHLTKAVLFWSKPWLAAMVMVGLVGHSVFAVHLHQHSCQDQGEFLLRLDIELDDDGQSGTDPASNGETNCISCRLGRSFAAEVPSTSAQGDLTTVPVRCEDRHQEPCSGCASLIPSDRAPPLV